MCTWLFLLDFFCDYWLFFWLFVKGVPDFFQWFTPRLYFPKVAKLHSHDIFQISFSANVYSRNIFKKSLSANAKQYCFFKSPYWALYMIISVPPLTLKNVLTKVALRENNHIVLYLTHHQCFLFISTTKGEIQVHQRTL